MLILGSILGIILLSCLFFMGKWYITYIEKNRLGLTAQLELSKLHEQGLQNQLAAMQTSLAARLIDPVTQLMSWQAFVERVEQRLDESLRFQFTLAMLTIDFMDFQIFIDALGCEVGDAILLEVAKRFHAEIRKVDSVSRSANNRFSVLLTKLTKPEAAAIVAQRLLNSLLEPIHFNGNTLYVSAYIGIAVYPTDGSEPATLFSKSEQALEHAKNKGGQSYHFYQEAMDSTSQYELALAAGLNRDTLFQELAINYSHFIFASTKTLFCLNAALSWHHPQLGYIDSHTLIQYAEKQGKSNYLFEWLLRGACQYFVKHHADLQTACLSLPVSIDQLKNSQFIYELSQFLTACDFNPEWLILDFSITTQLSSFAEIEKSINMLRYLNIKLAVHGFGVNSLSLYQLQQLGINYLYLHADLIHDVLQNLNTQALIKALVAVADSLAMQLLVEEMESAEKINLLEKLGCQVLQKNEIGLKDAPIST